MSNRTRLKRKLSSIVAPASSSTTFVFIVGINSEWEEDREKIGDIALHRCFLRRCRNSSKTVDFVKDEEATRETIEERFINLLQRSKEGDRLILYFGGHGEQRHFCTEDEGMWMHSEVVDTLERYFRGDVVWLLLDCCFSGNFYQTIKDKDEKCAPLRLNYLCIMSTQPDFQAGPNWTLTECFILALKTGLKYSARADDRAKCRTLAEVLGSTADEIARVKKELMTVYVHGDRIRPDAAFLQGFKIPITKPFQTMAKWISSLTITPIASNNTKHKKTFEHSSEMHLSWTGLSSCSVGDIVYAKWRGGNPAPQTNYIMPLWFQATVTSIHPDLGTAQIQFHDPAHSLNWHATAKQQHLLHQFYFSSTGDAQVDAQCIMARYLKFISYSIPPLTQIHVLWTDDHFYNATILSPRDVPWDDITEHSCECEFSNIIGPYVPVWWDEEETYSIVPLAICCTVMPNGANLADRIALVQNSAKEAAVKLASEICTPMDAILSSIKSCGKILSTAEDCFGTKYLNCYWSETDEWFPAQSVDIDDVCIQELASHLDYLEAGKYCVVRWDEDDCTSLLPIRFIERNNKIIDL